MKQFGTAYPRPPNVFQGQNRFAKFYAQLRRVSDRRRQEIVLSRTIFQQHFVLILIAAQSESDPLSLMAKVGRFIIRRDFGNRENQDSI